MRQRRDFKAIKGPVAPLKKLLAQYFVPAGLAGPTWGVGLQTVWGRSFGHWTVPSCSVFRARGPEGRLIRRGVDGCVLGVARLASCGSAPAGWEMAVGLAWVTGVAARACSASSELKEQRHLCGGGWDSAATQGQSRGWRRDACSKSGPREVKDFLKDLPHPHANPSVEGLHVQG